MCILKVFYFVAATLLRDKIILVFHFVLVNQCRNTCLTYLTMADANGCSLPLSAVPKIIARLFFSIGNLEGNKKAFLCIVALLLMNFNCFAWASLLSLDN